MRVGHDTIQSMFTGIVEHVGTVESVEHAAVGASAWSAGGNGIRLRVELGGWEYAPALGDSVAVNGCCLTAVAGVLRGGVVAFDVIPESLDKTNIGMLRAGDRVNLERAATASTLLGGHMVQGHVDGVGRVLRLETDGQWRIRIQPPESVRACLVPKGSVCVQGVSLTLAEIGHTDGPNTWFEVAIIPTTLEKTTLGSLKVGDAVNVEADAMAKTVVHYLRHFACNPGLAPSPFGVAH